MAGAYALQAQWLGKIIYSSSVLFSPVSCVRFSLDGKYLAIGCRDGTAQIHDVNEGAKQWYDQATLRYIWLLIHRHLSDLNNDESSQRGIYSVCFSPNSYCLATAGYDRRIRVSYRFFARLTARHDIHADLHHTATASETTDILYTLKLDLGYQEQADSCIPSGPSGTDSLT